MRDRPRHGTGGPDLESPTEPDGYDPPAICTHANCVRHATSWHDGQPVCAAHATVLGYVQHVATSGADFVGGLSDWADGYRQAMRDVQSAIAAARNSGLPDA